MHAQLLQLLAQEERSKQMSEHQGVRNCKPHRIRSDPNMPLVVSVAGGTWWVQIWSTISEPCVTCLTEKGLIFQGDWVGSMFPRIA